jgi:hypothetical protein
MTTGIFSKLFQPTIMLMGDLGVFKPQEKYRKNAFQKNVPPKPFVILKSLPKKIFLPQFFI